MDTYLLTLAFCAGCCAWVPASVALVLVLTTFANRPQAEDQGRPWAK